MTVQEVVAGGRRFALTGEGYAPEGALADGDGPVSPAGHAALHACLLGGALCGDGDVRHRDGAWEPVGDPMEAALVVAAAKAGLDRAVALRERPRVGVLPFDSARRFMATVHREPDGGRVVYVKGAPEQVLEALRSRAVRRRRHRGAGSRAGGAPVAEELARSGRRVLAFAAGRLEPEAMGTSSGRSDLTFLGLQALLDPPRPEAVAAVGACRRAGIAVKMITGDHAATAAAIAARVGLTDGGGAAGGHRRAAGALRRRAARPRSPPRRTCSRASRPSRSSGSCGRCSAAARWWR